MGNAAPEHALQVSVKRFLTVALPPQVEWTSSLAGAYLGPSQRAKAKAGGLRPGWPDLQFLIPGVGIRFIELKAERGRLSDDQERILSKLGAAAAVCRSVEEVEAALKGWGVRLRATVSQKPFPQPVPNSAQAGPSRKAAVAVVGVPAACAQSTQEAATIISKESTTTC